MIGLAIQISIARTPNLPNVISAPMTPYTRIQNKITKGFGELRNEQLIATEIFHKVLAIITTESGFPSDHVHFTPPSTDDSAPEAESRSLSASLTQLEDGGWGLNLVFRINASGSAAYVVVVLRPKIVFLGNRIVAYVTSDGRSLEFEMSKTRTESSKEYAETIVDEVEKTAADVLANPMPKSQIGFRRFGPPSGDLAGD